MYSRSIGCLEYPAKSLVSGLLFSKSDTLFHAFTTKVSDPTAYPRDIFWWNSNITRAFRNHDVEDACRCFEAMPYRNTVTWNCMISGYVHNHRIAEARRIFDMMPERNVVSWTALLTGYAKCGMLEEAQEMFNRIPERNVVSWNSMITGYVHCGRIEKAREMFDIMPMRNATSWVIMISGYLHHKLISEARVLFDQSPVHATSLCNALLSGYVELGHAKDAEDLFSKMQGPDAVSWNTMITCYARAGRMDLAKSLFDKMPEKDIISWTTIIRGYLKNGNVEPARQLFDAMPDRDIMAWNTMIGGYVHVGMLEDALRLFEMMPQRDIVSWNSILQGYVQCGDMINAGLWFRKMPQKSETSWNTLISGFRDEKALILLSRMVQEGFKPDQGTFTVAISVCASLVALGWGRMLHLHVIRVGYGHDTMIMSSLITMYSKCGLMADSVQVFKSMSKKDTVAYNAIIGAHAHHGLAMEALQFFDVMIKSGLEPDNVTFLCVLSACTHKGLVNEGWQHFESMQNDWKLVPKVEHYSCIIDLLGRFGFIDDACKLIEKMPVDLQTNAWETLLSSCIVHAKMDLGELAAERVLVSQPQDGGVYVLLSNFYAAKGLWQDAAHQRELMKNCGEKKETACSWIEVKGDVHTFVCNDKFHPQLDEIYRELDMLSVILALFNDWIEKISFDALEEKGNKLCHRVLDVKGNTC